MAPEVAADAARHPQVAPHPHRSDDADRRIQLRGTGVAPPTLGPWLTTPAPRPHPTSNGARATGTQLVKRGLAEMLKGGVIMDVVDPAQAKIAEDAGATAVDGARAGAVRHPPRRRRGPHERPGDDRGHQGRRHHPGHGQGPHRPLRRGADPRRRSASTTSTSPRSSPRPTRRTTSTSGPSRCRSCAAPPTSARRCGASARARA